MALRHDTDVYNSIEKYALTTLDLLPHTPVTAFGINVDFLVEEPEFEIMEIFDFKDDAKLSEAGISIDNPLVTRQLSIDKEICNLTIRKNKAQATFQFNFHHDAEDTGAIRKSVRDLFAMNVKKAIEIMSEIYSIELEEEI